MLTINYTFCFSKDSSRSFDVDLDPETLEAIAELPADLPQWTRLEFHQCEHCPLSPDQYPHCPVAGRLADLIGGFEQILSYAELAVKVVTNERVVTKTTTAQQGVSALMGLVMATSGCPHTGFFKPMARYHLPLASPEETAYRAVSMYLLSQYFVQKSGGKPDLKLDGLRAIYKRLQILNNHIAQRIRAASAEDAPMNALVILDQFAKEVSYEIEDQLENVEFLFKPYLEILDIESGKEP